MKLVVLLLLILSSNFSFAHGGGGRKPKDKEDHKSHRQVPRSVQILSSSDLQNFMSMKEIPEDVSIAKCLVDDLGKCRGIKLSLLDLSGNLIIELNSGHDGIFGVSGLEKNKVYVVRSQSERYKGESQFSTGKVNELSLIY